MFEVIVGTEFCAAHALRHYRGGTEPLHGHNFRVQAVVRGKKLQNKVKYLIDFAALQHMLQAVVQPMDHVNLNQVPPFDRENPSAENVARFIARTLRHRWREKGARLASVTVWETPQAAGRYICERTR